MLTGPHVRFLNGKRNAAFLVSLAVLATLRLQAADFFISNDGDDRATGDSTTSAWRTIDRVNQQRFSPSDRILFQAGQKFAGNLRLSAEDAGTADSPMVVTSFGEGRATILAGRGSGIIVENAGGIAIQNLIVSGAGRTNNSGYGILCENTLTNGQRLENLRIDQVEASGFGLFGILISGSYAGFEHVRVAEARLHDNLRGGMEIAGRLPYDAPAFAHADVQVTRCWAFDNTGDPDYLRNHSGSGIVLYQVDGGLIDHCAAWNNGGLCRSSGGGVGLWACASRKVIIQSCESFANRTSGGDGGGFDLDGGSVDCILQYNYSHDNDGPGLMVYSYPYASHADRGSVVRFNISENDSRKGKRYAGLWIRTDGPEITDLDIYNNTVKVGGWTDQAAYILGTRVEARLRNNIFVAEGAAVPLRVSEPGSRLRFENNLYWREGAPVQVRWDGSIFTSLGDWRTSTGQETLHGQPTGFFENPAWSTGASPSSSGKPIELATLRAFRPVGLTSILARGLDLHQLFATAVGQFDFLGSILPKDGHLPLGAIAGSASP